MLMLLVFVVSQAGPAAAAQVELFPLSPAWTYFRSEPARGGQPSVRTPMMVVDVTASSDGRLLLADDVGAIRSLGVGGLITDLVGGRSARGRPGDPPRLPDDRRPSAVAMLPTGELLVSAGATSVYSALSRISTDDPVVLHVRSDRTVAKLASVRAFDMAPLPAGGVLAVDETGHQVLRIGTDETVAVLAGNGTAGGDGDGGPATLAELSSPAGVALAPGGSVLVAEVDGDRIRRIESGDVISTVATLPSPRGVAILPDGSLAVTARRGLYRLASDGTMTRLAETRRSGDLVGRVLHFDDIELMPDGNLVLTSDGQLWLAALGPTTRFAVTVRSVRVGRHSVSVTVAATVPASVTLTARRATTGAAIASVKRDIPGGRTRIVFDRRFHSWPHSLELEATDEDGRFAADEVEAFIGPRLRWQDATNVIDDRGLIAAPVDGGPQWSRCRHFGRPRRLHCAYLWGINRPRFCETVFRVTLPRTGVPTVLEYDCPSRADRVFIRRPRS